ncbi:ATP-binding protein [Yersinia enterocolitica]|uniref:ATP-binding protein n=1 Tax=Enterobacterales TaxID=91347 RepID=UPI000EAC5B9C|nr:MULTISPECIES: ATP-binding protein [Enterobacterales]AYH27082.1 ATPase [Pectobacterium parmentieri]UYJ75544.1 ATP-binding protein [Yersinia enterocolitica]HEE0119966.1 ATP-binding protein [Citrobacter gillenii]
MALFTFNDDSYILGNIREVDTRKVTILVNSDKDLRKARVGQLVTVQLSGATECWLIGMIDKVIKAVVTHPLTLEVQEDDADEIDAFEDSVVNTVKITLMGGARWDAIAQKYKFSRSLDHVPEIDSTCYILKDAHLEEFMRVISECGNGEDSLELGSYKLNENARAYVDGNKLFQRHAALLGSTGSGKSWTVASILERSSRLPSSNLVVFDLHGEYKELSYAKQLRIPGPDEVNIDDNSLLFLPYWLLNSEEIQSLFVDRSEFSAHNQVVVVQDAITEQKKAFLQANGRTDLLQSFTLDSPIPYSLNRVIEKLKYLNEEKVDGSRGPKNGPFNGEFSRLLVRMASRLNDRRYGFLFDSPDKFNQYDSLSMIAEKLMEFGEQKQSIKVIDFSEVPADILPVIIGLVARIIYQVQFWTDPKSRRPVAFVCDEAHLYLPRKEGNPVERRAVEAFEKIAKEGRKYGVALMIVSQRPSDVSATILSQCNNIISLRLTNADDQATVRKLLPESLESLLEALPIMDVGEAMVVGDSVLLPSRIKIDPPTEKPLSATIDFWSRWQENVTNTDFALAVENMRRQNRTKL